MLTNNKNNNNKQKGGKREEEKMREEKERAGPSAGRVVAALAAFYALTPTLKRREEREGCVFFVPLSLSCTRTPPLFLSLSLQGSPARARASGSRPKTTRRHHTYTASILKREEITVLLYTLSLSRDHSSSSDLSPFNEEDLLFHLNQSRKWAGIIVRIH